MALGDQVVTVVADASGNAKAEIRCRSRNRNWTVQQISAQMPGAPIGCVCTVKKNGAFVTLLIPTGDSAAGDPPILLRGHSDILTVEYTGATPGAVGTVTAFYDESAV